MPKPKSPFRTYTAEQILRYEPITYVIVAGTDFYDVNGNYFFNKGGAVRNYNKIYRQLIVQMQSGTKKEQKNARRVLLNLRIENMRIH